MDLIIRRASEADLPAILKIYNQGIADRIATLEAEEKDEPYMRRWFAEHQGRYCVLVAELADEVIGWASLLFTFPFNLLGQALYRKCGYREVGVFRNQGMLDGKFVDVMAMEKLL